MRALILGIAGAIALAGAACAQPGWQPAELKDFRGTAEFRYRSPQVDFLSSDGDFDGDGKADKARLMHDDKAGKYAVEVTLANGKSQILVEGDLADLKKLGVTSISPGLYSSSCVKGPDVGPCASANIDIKRDAVSLFVFDGPNRYFWWTGTGFDQAWIVN